MADFPANADGQVITLKRYPDCVRLSDRSVLPLLKRTCLSYTEMGFSPSANNTLIRKFYDRPCWGERLNGEIMFSVGLAKLVVKTLQEHGYVVRVDDRRQRKSRRVAKPKLRAAFDESVREKCQIVQPYSLGQIEVARYEETLEWIAAMARLFRQSNILILASSNEIRKRMQRDLKRWHRTHVTLGRPRHAPPDHGLLLSPFIEDFDPRHWSVVLLPDMQGLLQNRSLRGAARARTGSAHRAKRVYAFVPRNRKLSKKEFLTLQAIAGDVIHELPRTSLRIYSHRVPLNSPVATAPTSGIEFNRSAYWLHARRNDKVAAIARALENRDFSYLKKLALPPEQDDFWAGAPHDLQVAVLVENSEHGRELQTRLPDWKLRMLNNRFKTEPDLQIVTVAAAQHRGLNTSVLIVASGDPTKLPLRTGTLNLSNGPPELLAIDFEDDFHQQAARRSSARKNNAVRQGWLPVG